MIVILFFVILAALAALATYAGDRLGKGYLHRFSTPRYTTFMLMGSVLAVFIVFWLLILSGGDMGDFLLTMIGVVSCSFIWMIFAASMGSAGDAIRTNEKRQEQLNLWLERLAKDKTSQATAPPQQCKGNPLKVAYDLERLGDLHAEAGNHEGALQAYDQACPIMVRELGDHPYVRDFLTTYAGLLRKADRIENAEQIELRLEAIGWEGDLA